MGQTSMEMSNGQRRVVIEAVTPEIDAGRFPIKRVVGETVQVEATIFTDGHDEISAILLYRPADESQYRPAPIEFVANDRWQGEFRVEDVGRYVYTLLGWVDHYKSWSHDLAKRIAAGQDIAVDRQIGAQLVEDAAARAGGDPALRLHEAAEKLRDVEVEVESIVTPQLEQLMFAYGDRQHATRYDRELEVVVDPPLARFSAWYELFPRSWSKEPGRHGTLRDVADQLEYIADLEFDVLYLPPIHPIGEQFRKGKNNSTKAEPGDVGSPWAIGGATGGHKSIHPELGTIEDFDHLVEVAKQRGIAIAMDYALQCSPDHPYVKEHPQWFKQRPDGTIQYAENPPKKYQDIYPFDFETPDWQALWLELKSILDYWIEHGVRVFRVDNPHTKPMRFWEWLIGSIKAEHPETIFLSEAFTRPAVMQYLAKVGFTQSYTYFTWRNTAWELTHYLEELTQTDVREYFRPNFWPNTPDILAESLWDAGRPSFIIRLVLAATLSSNYGIFGPSFELGDNRRLEEGREEYLDSEKYEIRRRDRNQPHSIAPIIKRVNQLRRGHPALQRTNNIQFHSTENEHLLAYSKMDESTEDLMLMVVNLDPHYTQSGWVSLPLEDLGIDPEQPFEAHDVLGDARYMWIGTRNYVELNPSMMPAHIFQIRRRLRTERDFDYYE